MAKKKDDSVLKAQQEALRAQEDSIKFAQEQIDKNLEIWDTLRKMRQEYGGITKEQEEELKLLEIYLKEYEEYVKKQNEALKNQKQINTAKGEENNIQKSITSNLDRAEKIYESIAEKLGEQSKGAEIINSYILKQKESLNSIASVATQIAGKDQQKLKLLTQANTAYSKYESIVADIARDVQYNTLTQEQANKRIEKAKAEMMASVVALKNMGDGADALVNAFTRLVNQSEEFGKTTSRTLAEFNMLKEFGNTLKSSGIPAMSQLVDLIKSAKVGGVAFIAAMSALGAVIGKMTGDYLLAGFQAETETAYAIRQIKIDTVRDVAKLEKDREFVGEKIAQERYKSALEAGNQINKLNNDAAFAAERASNSFAASMRSGAVQFEAASKTALFGKGIGSVNYGAAQLQLAGIGAEKIAEQMKTSATVMGTMPSAKLASDMAVFAQQGEISAETVAEVNYLFGATSEATAKTALNMQAGIKALADKKGLNFSNIMSDIQATSKSVLGFTTKNTAQLQRNAIYANSLGVSLQKVNQLGENMVLNYKDSIKAEMQLSSLLGEQVDLSEVRARFAEGDTAGALEALRAQGLDPNEMDAFQRQALQQALPGMDLADLVKINEGKAVDVGAAGVSVGDAGKANKDFLKATEEALKTLEIKQASISADAAIIDAKLAEKINQAFLASDEYKAYQQSLITTQIAETQLAAKIQEAWMSTDAYIKSIADTKKLEAEKNSPLNPSWWASAVGPVIGAAIGGGLGKAMTGMSFGGLFGKKGTAGGKPPRGGGGVTGVAAAGADSLIPGAGGVVDAALSGGGVTGVAAAGADSLIPGAGGVVDAALSGGGVTGVAAAGADSLIPGAGGVVENVAGTVDQVEEKLDKAMTLGQKIKDFGAGIGSFISSIGKGIGEAIGGILKGVASGLTALGTPQVLLGVVAMAGLAGTIWLAGIGLQQFQGLEWETIGMAFTTLLGLGAVGAILGTVSGFIITGAVAITAMSVAFAAFGLASGVAIPYLMQFQSLDAGALSLVGLSLVGLATGIAAFGTGAIIGAIGSFFSGGVFDDLKDISSYANPIMQTAIAVDALADSFSRLSSIDVSALTKIPWDDMEDFAAEGGKIITNVGTSATASTKSAAELNELKAINANTRQMVELTKAMQVIAAAQYQYATTKTAPIKLSVDGKTLANAAVKYENNNKAGKKPGT